MYLNKLLITNLLIVFTTINICLAQQKQLKITVKNTDKTSLPGATVQLKNKTTSSSEYATTNLDGLAYFNKFANGLYSINITYIGFKPVDTTIRITSVSRNFEFVMASGSIALGEVTITGRKPLISQDGDKMIIDPTPLANTATNTLEVLESTPGLYVDQEGGIFLNSSTAAVVYINGREQKMSTQDITTILRSLPPNSVERIEVLRTPSTKYDAASSGGIINIVLKKGVKIGRFGSVNLGMNQGVYGNRYAGFSYNNSGNKGTSYLNFNYSHNDYLEELNSLRYLQKDTTLMQSAKTRNTSTPLFLGFGTNYEASPKINLSYDGRINSSSKSTSSKNNNIIKTPEDNVLSESDNFTNSTSRFFSLQQDFGMLMKFDTLGSEWDTKLSYSYNRNSADQDYRTEFLVPVDTEYSGKGNNLQSRHFFVFQSDLTYQLPLKIKLETGVKSSWQKFESNAGYFINFNGSQVDDPKRTNAFSYLENINAAYLQASRPLFAGLNLKTGLRMEHTYMNGHQTVPGDTSFRINRADWFPYVYLSRRVLKIMGAELFGYLIYRKTISRPGYQDLNPYIKFVDQFLYEAGNPALKPQFTDNIELNISYDDMPVFAIGRNTTRDIFSMVMYKDSTLKSVLVRTYDNVGTNTDTYFRGMVGIPPGGKYFFAIGAQYDFNEYDGIYENLPLKYSRGSWRFFTFHSLNLFKETKLTVNGFMMTNGQWNFYEMKTFGQLNVGLTQTFLDKKLTVSLNARDIFRTMGTEFEFNQGSISSSGNRYSDSRRFGINLRYNFGLKKKKEESKGIPGFEVPEF
jgi:iron complex outermembrane recepter protein